MLREHLVTTDEFNRPKVLKGKDALSVLLLRLLLMEPGDNFDHPEMGIDVIGRYRYSQADDLKTLEKEIEMQIEQYLPTYRVAEVKCTKVEKYIEIAINIDDTLFSFTTQSGKDVPKEKISLSNDESII